MMKAGRLVVLFRINDLAGLPKTVICIEADGIENQHFTSYRIGIGKVVKETTPVLCTPITTVPNFINGVWSGKNTPNRS
jgi:hypothetical protein